MAAALPGRKGSGGSCALPSLPGRKGRGGICSSCSSGSERTRGGSLFRVGKDVAALWRRAAQRARRSVAITPTRHFPSAPRAGPSRPSLRYLPRGPSPHGSRVFRQTGRPTTDLRLPAWGPAQLPSSSTAHGPPSTGRRRRGRSPRGHPAQPLEPVDLLMVRHLSPARRQRPAHGGRPPTARGSSC